MLDKQFRSPRSEMNRQFIESIKAGGIRMLLQSDGDADKDANLDPFVVDYIKAAAPSRVLDIGCGYQHYRGVIDGNYTGLDIVPRRGCVIGDAHSLPFEDNSFDLALMIDVIEHLRSPDTALKEALRVAKRVLVKVPLGTYDDCDSHVRIFDLADLQCSKVINCSEYVVGIYCNEQNEREI